ncbi:MAG: MFS transporter [Actinobacteria bacterium]|nr:MFS transporter [Actinomycetota bacterium]
MPQAPVDVSRVQRTTLGTLSAAQVLGGIAIAGSIPAGALIAASLDGDGAAGLAATSGVLGAAIVALPLARLALSRGRRISISTGYATGAIGALVVIAGGVHQSTALVLIGCLFVGAASAAGYQARYGAIDLAVPGRRARALSIVVWATTLGAVLGPNLLEVSGNVALALGLPQLTGAYLLAFAVLALAVLLLMTLLRPDPYLLSRALADQASGTVAATPRLRDGLTHLRGHRLAVLGVISLSIGHVVMVMVMVMTPVHMSHVDISLQLIGLVISVHVLGMYALSPVVGWLVDRIGRVPMLMVGAVVLLVACLVSALVPANSVVGLGIGLFLLGLGWSCTLIAGSTLLTEQVEQADRPSVQGLADLVMNVAGALGGVIAGIIVLKSSYTVLCLAAIVPVLVLAALCLPWLRRRPAAPAELIST